MSSVTLPVTLRAAQGWRFISDPAGGTEERQDLEAQKAIHGRPTRAMVGWLKMKGIRNISLTRKQDPGLYPACNER